MAEPMKLDELIALADKAGSELDVPWDEVRQARVHRRALEAFRDQTIESCDGERPEAAPKREDDDDALAPNSVPLKAWPRWIYAAAAILLLVGFGAAALTRGGAEGPVATSVAASTVGFSDGSRSLLFEDAELQVLEDASERVKVRQAQGRVRYEIERRPARRFVVVTHGVKVTVLGTIFDVDVSDGRVAVSVTRGKVRVERGAEVVILTAGERVEMATGTKVESTSPAPAPPRSKAPPATASAEPHPEKRAVADDVEPRPMLEPTSQAGGAAPAGPDAATLLSRADAARAEGRLTEAASLLQRLVASHPRDPRVTMALFSLGRVERQRHRHEAAARAFDQCGAGLRGDAMAEAAASWLAAGQAARARAAATRYLATYPEGVHAAQMRKLAHGQ